MAVTEMKPIRCLMQFYHKRLPILVHYQDAMIADEPFMYHAHIGLYLNIGLAEPDAIIRPQRLPIMKAKRR